MMASDIKEAIVGFNLKDLMTLQAVEWSELTARMNKQGIDVEVIAEALVKIAKSQAEIEALLIKFSNKLEETHSVACDGETENKCTCGKWVLNKLIGKEEPEQVRSTHD